MIDSKSLFLGPYGENREEFLKLFNLLFEDVMQWRRNFHPEDNRLITREDQRSKGFQRSQDKIYEVLDKLLSEMKQSIPFHSPRFLGHMHSDLLIPSLLGYFSGMLFNQNNVVGESSPITTRKEIEFCTRLCEMIGYKPYGLTHTEEGRSFGHLSSGGSTAILEAMWVARNLKYYPLSLRLLVETDEKYEFVNKLTVKLPNGSNSLFVNLTIHSLFNLRNEDILNFRNLIITSMIEELQLRNQPEANKLLFKDIDEYTIQNLGVHGIHSEVYRQFETNLNLPLIYVSTASHYSWQKNLDILGIGKKQVIKLKCDSKFKIDISDFKEKILINQESPILMVAGMLGTTEEGAIDPIKEIVALREQLEQEQNKSFYFQIDGAWGGYFCSVLHESKTEKYTPNEAEIQIIQSLQSDLECVRDCDSIVIDPHKMGYVPYAVGSISYKDTRYKDFIYKEAPYLAAGNDFSPIERTYLGGWTLEGSRSGAAALACAMSTEVLPLNQEGYGRLILDSIKSTRNFLEAVNSFTSANGIKIIPGFNPQTNILCFIVSAPTHICNPKYLNKLNEVIYNELSIQPDKVLPSYRFVTSKTDLSIEHYKEYITKILEDAGCSLNPENSFSLQLLRSVIMHQNIDNYQVQVWENGLRSKKNLFDAFLSEIDDIAQKALPSILLSAISNINKKGERIRILWVENKPSFKQLQRLLKTEQISSVPPIGRFLDITFYDCEDENINEELEKIIKGQVFDFSIIDLDLVGGHENDNSGYSVIKQLYTKDYEGAGIPILFSKFFDDMAQRENLPYKYKRNFQEVFKSDLQFLHKKFNASLSERDNEKLAINELVMRIDKLIKN